MSAVRKLIIDLDGTLVDDSTRHWNAYKRLIGVEIPKTMYWAKRREGISNLELTRQLFPSHSFIVDDFKELIESREFLEMDERIPTFVTLERLSRGFDMILCTVRSNEANCMWQLKKLGLLKYFNKIIVVPHIELHDFKSKAPFLVKQLSINANDTIIGDTEIDIKTGKVLGMQTVAVTSGIRSKNFLVSISPDQILDNIYLFR